MVSNPSRIINKLRKVNPKSFEDIYDFIATVYEDVDDYCNYKNSIGAKNKVVEIAMGDSLSYLCEQLYYFSEESDLKKLNHLYNDAQSDFNMDALVGNLGESGM